MAPSARCARTGVLAAVRRVVLGPALAALLAAGAPAAPGGRGADDLPARVAALVAERCAPCHSPTHPDAAGAPKALRAWPGATDLAAVIETAVVPGEPGESDLYLAVELDDMPPPDATQPRLTAEEKELLRAWITAGAPIAAAPATPPGAGAAGEGPGRDAEEAPAPRATGVSAPDGSGPRAAREAPSALELAGRFHPLAVHFPIALLLVAVPAALLARLRRSTAWELAADYCAALGALGAAAAAALGWCAHEAGAGKLQPALLERHEWTGFAAAGLALLAVAAARAARRGRAFGRLHLPLLLAAALVVAVAGHYGGALVWGEDHLPLPMPF